MPRHEHLFGDVVDPSVKMGNRLGRSVAMTVVIEASLVIAMITIPMLAPDVLPVAPDLMAAFVAVSPPPTPPPPPPLGRRTAATPSVPQVAEPVNPDVAPTEAPRDIAPEPAPVDTGFERGGTLFVGEGVPGGTGDVTGGFVGAPPPVVPPPVVARSPLRVGGIVQAPKKIRDVRPSYPPLALRAGVQGSVILEATIDAAGKVTNVHVVQSRPLLDQAAIDAVMQWQFTPTLLGGEPTAVIMNVTVNFQLN
jgi:protein TonB